MGDPPDGRTAGVEPGHDYTCAHCGGAFTTTAAGDIRAKEETLPLWDAPWNAPNMVEICDPCFRQFMAWLEAHPEERQP